MIAPQTLYAALLLMGWLYSWLIALTICFGFVERSICTIAERQYVEMFECCHFAVCGYKPDTGAVGSVHHSNFDACALRFARRSRPERKLCYPTDDEIDCAVRFRVSIIEITLCRPLGQSANLAVVLRNRWIKITW
jgi:hypothetical protein